MKLSWEILDLRAKVAKGCYFVSLCHAPGGHFWLARFCLGPGQDNKSSLTLSRSTGIGHSNVLEDVQEMCNVDASHNHYIN